MRNELLKRHCAHEKVVSHVVVEILRIRLSQSEEPPIVRAADLHCLQVAGDRSFLLFETHVRVAQKQPCVVAVRTARDSRGEAEDGLPVLADETPVRALHERLQGRVQQRLAELQELLRLLLDEEHVAEQEFVGGAIELGVDRGDVHRREDGERVVVA